MLYIIKIYNCMYINLNICIELQFTMKSLKHFNFYIKISKWYIIFILHNYR